VVGLEEFRIIAVLGGSRWSDALGELRQAGLFVVELTTLREARAEIAARPCDLLLTTVLELGLEARCPFLLLVCESSEELAIRALRAGARDYLRYPCRPGELLHAVRGCLPARMADARTQILGSSAAMQRVREQIVRVGRSDANVLLTGETGTGKELAAHCLHQNSARRDAPFVALNCAAMPSSLIESELFGYERGAFTGAHQMHRGKLECASGGTVLLDEIGDMDLYAQAKILRAIESRTIQRLGGHDEIALDVRVVAATNRNLEKSVTKGGFRADLYFRLNVARVHLPALRERREDIPLLFASLLEEAAARQHRKAPQIATGAIERLMSYDWPGNVRELRNAAEWTLLFCDFPELRAQDLPAHIAGPGPLAVQKVQSEKEQILFALNSTDWNKAEAARRLRCSRMTLYRKLEKFGIA